MKELFKVRLKSLRKENLKTQEDMSNFLGVARSTYAEYERGNITPTTNTVQRLAEYFNVSVDYLLGNSNFKTLEERKEAGYDVTDVEKQIKILMDYLEDNSKLLTLDGELLEGDSREMLNTSLQNTLRMIKAINKKG